MRSMLRFSVPMILGNLLQQCYNVADTLIVSRYVGPDALAAVGSSFIAQNYGARKFDRIRSGLKGAGKTSACFLFYE